LYKYADASTNNKLSYQFKREGTNKLIMCDVNIKLRDFIRYLSSKCIRIYENFYIKLGMKT